MHVVSVVGVQHHEIRRNLNLSAKPVYIRIAYRYRELEIDLKFLSLIVINKYSVYCDCTLTGDDISSQQNMRRPNTLPPYRYHSCCLQV